MQALAARAFPRVRRARWAEWWAHCRPHHSAHQLHFDSDDEGRGAVRNPICSCVLYVSAACGGPTLVTDQPYGGAALATRGWLVHPASNRMAIFDARYLHGVIPGRGPSPSPAARRTTFMVAFWEELTVRHGATPGAARPFPAAAACRRGPPASCPPASEQGVLPLDQCTWPALFSARDRPLNAWGSAAPVPAPVVALPGPVWEDVDEAANLRLGCAVSQLRELPAYELCFQF